MDWRNVVIYVFVWVAVFIIAYRWGYKHGKHSRFVEQTKNTVREGVYVPASKIPASIPSTRDELSLQDFLAGVIRRLDFKILMYRPPWTRADILMNLATLLIYQAQKELVKKVDVTPPEVIQKAFERQR